MKQRTFITHLSTIEICEQDGFLIELNFVDASKKKNDESVILDEAEKQIKEYLNGTRDEFTIPMKYEGTTFQKKVWEAMLRIPYGDVRSYKDIAVMIDNPKSCRAVGNACNKNPIAILIPCHRVVGANHKLGGFGFNLDLKLRLLAIEKVEY